MRKIHHLTKYNYSPEKELYLFYSEVNDYTSDKKLPFKDLKVLTIPEPEVCSFSEFVYWMPTNVLPGYLYNCLSNSQMAFWDDCCHFSIFFSNCLPSHFTVEHVKFMQNIIYSRSITLCKYKIWKSKQQLENFSVTTFPRFMGNVLRIFIILKLSLFNTLTLCYAKLTNTYWGCSDDK